MQYKNKRISSESLFFYKSSGVYWNFVSFQLPYLKLHERHATSHIHFFYIQPSFVVVGFKIPYYTTVSFYVFQENMYEDAKTVQSFQKLFI